MLTDDELSSIVRAINTIGAKKLLDEDADGLLSEVSSSEDVIRLVDAVDPTIDAARMLYRAARRVGGAAPAHARWLLAGAFSLEGLDDVAHAIEPEQQTTGLIKRSYQDGHLY